MSLLPIRIRAKTDKGRSIILHPQWCDKKKEYLLYDEAVIQYRSAFNTRPDMLVVIMMDGKDVSDRRFVMRKQDDTDDIAIKSDMGKNDDRFTIVGKINDDVVSELRQRVNDDDDDDVVVVVVVSELRQRIVSLEHDRDAQQQDIKFLKQNFEELMDLVKKKNDS